MRRAALTTSGAAAVGFGVTFGAVRALTYTIHVGVGPFHDVSAGGAPIHHKVWGMFLLLPVGYVRFLRDSLGAASTPVWPGLPIAAPSTVGAAFPLDVFGLW